MSLFIFLQIVLNVLVIFYYAFNALRLVCIKIYNLIDYFDEIYHFVYGKHYYSLANRHMLDEDDVSD